MSVSESPDRKYAHGPEEWWTYPLRLYLTVFSVAVPALFGVAVCYAFGRLVGLW